MAGCLGGLIGWLVSRGRARAFVLSLVAGLIGFGGLVTAGAVAALAAGQPLHVWGPLLLLGAVLLAVFPALLPRVRNNYAALELRRMAARDALQE